MNNTQRDRRAGSGRSVLRAGALGLGVLAFAAALGGHGLPLASAAPVLQASGTPAAPPSVDLPPVVMPDQPAMGGFAVTQHDIYFDPAMLTIPANLSVKIGIDNAGAAMHNFSITSRNNPGLPDLGISVDLDPGQSGEAIVDAPPGVYYFFCDEPGHEAAGMFGYLTVR